MPSAPKASKTAAKKATPRKTAAKPPTAGKRGSARTDPPPSAASEPRPAWVMTTLSAFCSNAEDVEAGESAGDATALRRACPIATYQAAYVRTDSNGKNPEVVPERLTVCVSDWHDHHPACYVCKATDTELHTTHPQCVDVPACADRAQARLEAHPGWQRWQQFMTDFEDKQAVAEAADPSLRRTRKPRQDRPTSGRCEHCGEPTKGGKFVAGHDAKLKGDLIRAGQAGDIEAVAEAMARNWYKPGRFPDLEPAAFEVVQYEKTDALIARLVAQRLENL